MEGLEDRDLVTIARELPGGGQAGRTGAHDGDPTPQLGLGLLRELVTVLHGPVGHESLQRADGHRLALLAADAESLALRLLGTDPPGHAGQRVVAEQRIRRARQVALGQALDEAGDVDAYRAAV